MSMNVPNGPRMFKHGVNYPQATRQKLYSKNTVRDLVILGVQYVSFALLKFI